MQEGFFERSGDSFVPTDRARGPWGPDTLHGRVIAGLFAHCFEQELGDPSFHFARLTVDLFRMPKVRPVEVSVETIRTGRRIRVAQGVITSEGKEIARARVVQLRKSEAPPGEVWMPERWDAPPPHDLEPMPATGEWVPIWETRFIGDTTYWGPGQKQLWMREIHTVVAGEPLTPFTRVAGGADIASPMANSSDGGLHYVNADITLYLARLPVSEWVGWEVAEHQSADGVAIGECKVYDEQGLIGTSSVCAVTNRDSNLNDG